MARKFIPQKPAQNAIIPRDMSADTNANAPLSAVGKPALRRDLAEKRRRLPPIHQQVRMMRHAISQRLAIRILSNMGAGTSSVRMRRMVLRCGMG